MLRRHSFVLILIVLLLPLGCKTQEMGSWVGISEPEKPLIERVTEAAAEANATAAEARTDASEQTPEAAAPVGNAAPEAAIAIPEKALVHQRLVIGVARSKELEEYLNAVLRRLQAAWPGEPVPSYVFVRPSSEFDAFSSDHAIFVDYGLLRSLNSEDEIAALLGHEYSHILLNHQALGDFADFLSLAYGLYDTGSSIMFNVKKDTKGYVTREIISAMADRMNQKAFIPVFDREQEEDADALGTDLLIRSGYSPMGMVRLLQQVGDWEAQQEKIKEEARQAKLAKADAEANATGSVSLEPLFTDLGKAIAKISREHPSAVEREQAVKEYIRSFYSAVPRNDPLVEPYQSVLNNRAVRCYFSGLDGMEKAKAAMLDKKFKTALNLIRSKQCHALMADVSYVRYLDRSIAWANGKCSLKTLEGDCRRSGVLLKEYENLMAVYEVKSPDKALDVAKTAFKDLDEPRGMLPTLIRLNQELGNGGESLSYQVACKTAGDPGLSALCAESAKTEKRKDVKKKKK